MSRGTALIYSETGEIVGVRSGAIVNLQIDIDKNNGRGIFVEPDDVPENTDDYYVSDDGVLTPKGNAPNETAQFDYGAKAWSYDLQRHKNSVWRSIKAARNAAEFGTFTWSSHTFQCDEISQRRIQSAVQLAQLDSTVSVTWTLSDNTTQVFNATELQQIGQALSAHINACHDKARAKRSEIDSATTEEQINSVSW